MILEHQTKLKKSSVNKEKREPWRPFAQCHQSKTLGKDGARGLVLRGNLALATSFVKRERHTEEKNEGSHKRDKQKKVDGKEENETGEVLEVQRSTKCALWFIRCRQSSPAYVTSASITALGNTGINIDLHRSRFQCLWRHHTADTSSMQFTTFLFLCVLLILWTESPYVAHVLACIDSSIRKRQKENYSALARFSRQNILIGPNAFMEKHFWLGV